MTDKFLAIIGAQRSGSTYLASMLDQHPQIEFAKPLFPEPKYFLQTSVSKSDYLIRYFPQYEVVDTRTYLAEKGTSYYENKEVASKILDCFPQACFILVLRDPVYRAISNYFFSLKHGLETRTLEQVFLEQEPRPALPVGISTNPFNYLERGRYIKYIHSYLSHINRKSLHIVFFEEITKDMSSLNILLEFLQLPAFKFANFGLSVNAGQNKTPISGDIIEKLQKYYQPYNKELADFIARDLPFGK